MNYVEIYSDNTQTIPCEACSVYSFIASFENIEPDYQLVSEVLPVVHFKSFDIYNNSKNHIYRVRYNRCRACLTEYINIEKYGMHYGNLLQRNVPISQLDNDETVLLLKRISEFNILLSDSQEKGIRTDEYFKEIRKEAKKNDALRQLELIKKYIENA